MEKIAYRKTLDVHKNGVQFLLQGFETADNMSRVVEISLMASGDAIDFPLERIVAMMYVTSPGATEPSINECTIRDNKVVYDVLPITEEGITTMQIKLIETSPEGAKRVLASPKFAVEVTKSGTGDESAEKTTTFTALEEAMANAKIAYDERFLRMELSSDCMFRAYYADGTVYETDILKKIFVNGNVLLSESFAHGGTGVRAGEDTDNSMYYSNVSKSEALNAKAIMQNSEEVLEEVKLHGVYTAFAIDFTTGEVEYVSPSFKFKVNPETGELDAEGQTYSFEDEVARIVAEWLLKNGVVLDDLADISKDHAPRIASLEDTTADHTKTISAHTEDITKLYKGVEEAKTYREPWSVDGSLIKITNGYSSKELKAYGTDLQEETTSIYMINSGQIYLSYNYEWGVSNSGQKLATGELDIYINDKKVHSSVIDDANQSTTVYEKILLTVKKGDIVSLKMAIQGTSSDSGYWIRLECNNVTLYANSDTPYTYINFPLSEDNTITVDEIVNTLLGVE